MIWTTKHKGILAIVVIALIGLISYTGYTQIVAPQRVKPPQPPLARIIYSPEHPAPMQKVIFDGTGSVSLSGDIVKYVWTINGTRLKGKTVHHSFESGGEYRVTLKVVDSNGLSNTTTVGIVVG